MTENEAIKGLETLKYQCKHNGECGTCNVCCSAIPLAIQALEEIQQYRAIGTVEEFKALKEKSVAKKVNIQQWIYTECECGYEFSKHHGDGYYSIPYEKQTNYCPNCGQKLDWQ